MTEQDVLVTLLTMLVNYFGDSPIEWLSNASMLITSIIGFASLAVFVLTKIASWTETTSDDEAVGKISAFVSKIINALRLVALNEKDK